MFLSAILLNPLALPAQIQQKSDTSTPLIDAAQVMELLETTLNHDPQKIEDITGPLVEAGKRRREKARKAAEAAEEAHLASLPPWTPTPAPQPATAPQNGSLIAGTRGYALPYGNCINQVPYTLRGQGNPINWSVLTQTPYIGAAALWYFNHTGRVVGMWSNGDLEIAHENWGGYAQTRFPRSAFRGFR